jgi:hypothetical protein
MNDPVTVIIGVGQLGTLVEIARRMGRLRSDMQNVRARVASLEKEAS